MLIIETTTKTYAFLSVASLESSQESGEFTVRSDGRGYTFRIPVEGTKGETIVGIFAGKDGKTEIPHLPEGERPRRGRLSESAYEQALDEYEASIWEHYMALPGMIARGVGC